MTDDIIKEAQSTTTDDIIERLRAKAWTEWPGSDPIVELQHAEAAVREVQAENDLMSEELYAANEREKALEAAIRTVLDLTSSYDREVHGLELPLVGNLQARQMLQAAITSSNAGDLTGRQREALAQPVERREP